LDDFLPVTQLHFDEVLVYLPFLLQGVVMTFVVSITSMAFGLVIGLVVAVARLSRLRIVNEIAGFYIAFFQSTPVLVQLIWIFFVMPILLGISLNPFVAGITALSLYVGAYLAEVYRTGINSIERGQWLASAALGMTYVQTMHRIILPQAIVRMLPPFSSMFITLFKESALVSVIGIADLMRQGLALAQFTFRPLEALTVTCVIYLIITYPQTLLANYLHKRYLAH
jgi:polar amino acid transport system permease protein